MKIFEFTINELPPSVNKLYKPRASRYRGLYIQKDASAGQFEYSAWAEVKTPEEPFDCPLAVSIVFEIKDSRKFKMSDIDNMLKCLFDTLQKIRVIKNDNLIRRITIEKVIGQKDKTIGQIKKYK